MTKIVINTEIYLQNTNESKELLYKHFAPKMYGICLRFAGNAMEADDILQESFIKIFNKIKDFRNEGSLEGWIRRTIINTAINFYRRNVKFAKMGYLDEVEIEDNSYSSIYSKLSSEEILNLVQELPIGYRTVFNLNVIEGYTHKEIGKMLNISDNTSKSQLTRARSALQVKIKNLVKEKVKVPFENLRVIKSEPEPAENERWEYLQAV
ncbi:MAG: sigma-70 family RNA polymerase sigma factor [Bacteroidales bacterium]|nr:sigma-70 family RNA polymerase sigma factor [Bacteroidales bacterium]MCF8405657.1 sigma-70 family RNA polymerase sigma factor [Bacteroidales bacterium]